EGRHDHHHAAGVATSGRHADREVVFGAVERIEQRESAFRSQQIERVMGRYPEPDELEIVEIQRIDDKYRERLEVVEGLAVSTESSVDVGQQRAEGYWHSNSDDRPERREIARGMAEDGETDAQRDRVQDVAFLVHRIPNRPTWVGQ